MGLSGGTGQNYAVAVSPRMHLGRALHANAGKHQDARSKTLAMIIEFRRK